MIIMLKTYRCVRVSVIVDDFCDWMSGRETATDWAIGESLGILSSVYVSFQAHEKLFLAITSQGC